MHCTGWHSPKTIIRSHLLSAARGHWQDGEGSTGLFEADPDAMDSAMEIHNRLMREVVDKHAGYPSTSEGDGWWVAIRKMVPML